MFATVTLPLILPGVIAGMILAFAKAMGDPVFRRAVTNIVGNAQRYGGRIEVALNRRRGSVEIVVDDDGPGVPKDSREEVFKPFFRLDGSRNEETGGTGLGLTIARDILRSHGGDLTLGDSPLGGLRAVLRVPV